MEIPKEHFEPNEDDDLYSLCLALMIFARNKVQKHTDEDTYITMVITTGEDTLMVHAGNPQQALQDLITGAVEIITRQPDLNQYFPPQIIRDILNELDDEED